MRPLTIVLAGLLLGSAPASPSREIERNKAVARQLFEEVFGPRWRIELVDQIHTQDFVAHTVARDVGLQENRQSVIGWKAAAPDMVLGVERMVAEGDLVAVHWNGSGTNTGEGNGLPATGRKVTVRGMTFFRFRDGRIAEEWNTIDMLGVMRQLGLLPDPAGE
jgi:steroid delta-isomerase-like uncharacterized protein